MNLIELLRCSLDVKPELQIVCATHSPYMVDLFAEDEIRVMNRDNGGFAVCRPLSAHPDWPRWKGVMMMGEFWSSVGEQWVKDEAEEHDS